MGANYWVDLYLKMKFRAWAMLAPQKQAAILAEVQRNSLLRERNAAIKAVLAASVSLLLALGLFCVLPLLWSGSLWAASLGLLPAGLVAQWLYAAHVLLRDKAAIERELEGL